MNIENVEYAQLLEEPINVKSGNYSPIWKGGILTRSNQQVISYIKVLPPEEFLAEIFCALLGKCISLPIPMTYIVNTGNFLREHTSKLGHTLAFGSSEMEIPSFSQWLKSSTPHSDKVLLDKIKNWPYLYNAAAFDEWVANSDRHFGNILFAGQDNFYLIDHGHCFTGPGWSRKKLDPDVIISPG